jgi:Zn-dependent peptidase ImmA (M78 family)
MNYKNLYKELARILWSMNCYVCDLDSLGHATKTDKTRAFIYVNAHMSYKHKYFVLAHEAGHLFYMKKNKIFNWSKKIRSEKQANFFAIQLLRLSGIDVSEYYLHYDKAVKKSKKRRKTWFEI